MKKILCIILASIVCLTMAACGRKSHTSTESDYTQALMTQSNDEIGMPDITEFYEKKLAKEIFEKRDDSSLICYVYNQNRDGQYIYVGKSMGYGLPYSTQYTAPTIDDYRSNGATLTTHQADPNALYTADGLSATWLLMVDEETGENYIMYCEPTIIVTENKLPERLIAVWSLEGTNY